MDRHSLPERISRSMSESYMDGEIEEHKDKWIERLARVPENGGFKIHYCLPIEEALGFMYALRDLDLTIETHVPFDLTCIVVVVHKVGKMMEWTPLTDEEMEDMVN